MRFIIYGVGAIGGVIAASLALAGKDVAAIARGKQLEAIRADGLLLRTPDGDHRAHFPAFADPSEVDWRPDDVIMLTMKGQDTLAALLALREAGVRQQPIVCAQNGIDNERQALRFFPHVYAATVMLPGGYSKPGEVDCPVVPKRGIFDLGCYPRGVDDVIRAVAADLASAEFAVFLQEEVMRSKHGKLLENQRNIIEAVLGSEVDRSRFDKLVDAEGRAVYEAAGIEWMEIGGNDPRRKGVMSIKEVPGLVRSGNSSTQSLARGTGSIETDYLNGEIVLLGRLHGVPVPVNTVFVELGQRMVREKLQPGAITPQEVDALIAERQSSAAQR